jgi:hypothetical protein
MLGDAISRAKSPPKGLIPTFYMYSNILDIIYASNVFLGWDGHGV